MRQIILLAAALFSFTVKAQINWVEYAPVPNPSANSSNNTLPTTGNPFGYNQPSRGAQQDYPIVGAYYYSNRRLKRIKIKINPSYSYGLVSVYMRGVYDSTTNMWISTNLQATKVDKAFDGEFIADNFEWKAYHQFYGNIYFND